MSTHSGQIAGLILAAGASSRMGRPKALLAYQGVCFLDRLVGLFATCCSPVVVVLGFHAAAIREGARTLSAVTLVTNPEPEAGQLSSLQCALRSLDASCAGAIFCPVDLPSIKATTVLGIAGELRSAAESGGPLLVIPQFEGKRGHPVGVRRELFPELLRLAPTGQARDVIRAYSGSAIYVDVDDPGVLRDIDSPSDYRNLLSEEAAQ